MSPTPTLEDICKSKDSEDEQPSSKRYNDSSFAISGQNTSAEDELTESSKGESNNEGYFEPNNNNLTTRSSFIKRDGGVCYNTYL